MMNPRIKELAEDAGFCFWEDEEWKPHGAIIDWSAQYDKEFQKYTELLIEDIIKLNYEDEFLSTVLKVSFENKVRTRFGIKDD